MVKLNTTQVVIGKDKVRCQLWQNIFLRSLNANPEGVKFVQIVQKVMVGCFIIMFVREEHVNKIRNIRKVKVMTGFSGMTGNKGGVALRFSFLDTSFAFINVHLESGQNAMAQRLENVRQIFHDTFNDFAICNTQQKSQHDYKFFFGDMNFRVDLDNAEVRSLIAQGNFRRLVAFDQLLRLKQDKANNQLLKAFEEGPLLFPPTYKFDPNSDQYDSSQKNRIPAWCDRILMCRDQEMKKELVADRFNGLDSVSALPITYTSKHSYLSDHRPVLGVYDLQVVEIDQEKKDSLRKEVLLNIQRYMSGQISKESFEQMNQSQRLSSFWEFTGDLHPSQPPLNQALSSKAGDVDLIQLD
mmetsp:Transcript_12774/g.21584  ORF Transcript_12774/g.21584 Transcript_12774/m.21584 type:complete len:355 (-) Transcript_12774:22-1086(-)